MKRADIVIGTGLEKGSSESVVRSCSFEFALNFLSQAIPILASMTHVLFDLYDESKQSGESLNKFVVSSQFFTTPNCSYFRLSAITLLLLPYP